MQCKCLFQNYLQYDQSKNYVRGSEDCLVVSVYTPELPEKDEPLLPVFVWLHGNELHKGSGNGDMQGPNRIMDYDIIMVTVNFRLGALGKENLIRGTKLKEL